MEQKKSLKEILVADQEAKEEQGIKKIMGEEEKALDGWLGKTKEHMDVGKWLKKARHYELKGDHKRALDFYLRFMEVKLNILGAQPKYGLGDYLGLVKYYEKIAECYEKVTHTTKEGKKRDMDNAGKYYTNAGRMYIERDKYDESYKCYENAARCYDGVGDYLEAAKSYMEVASIHYRLKRMVLACSSFIKAAQSYEKTGDYVSASKQYLHAAELDQDIDDIYGAISAYKKVAECYDKLGKAQESIGFYIQSAELSSKVEHYSEVAEKYEGISRSYERLGEYEKAVYYHLHSANLNLGNDNLAASYGYDNAAKAYAKLEKYAETIRYYTKSMKLRTELKKYPEAASASLEIAKYYEKINDFENAAKFHFQYAELGLLGKQQQAGKGYGTAAKLYVDMAKKRIDENNYAKAIDNYLKATECYDRLNDSKTSADMYSKMAEMEQDRDYNNSIKFYIEAAKRYTKIADIANAAKCYTSAKDYLNAAKYYGDYAELQLKMNQPFYAGSGYRKAADSYARLKNPGSMRNSYNKAIYNYVQYLEKSRYSKDSDEGVNLGNAHKNIGECYIELDDIPNAKKHLEKAIDYYKENKIERELGVADALLTVVNANLSLKLGEYGKATKLLRDSLKLLESTIKEGNWTEGYVEFLTHNKENIEELLKKIEAKPEIGLVMEQPKEVFSFGEINIVGKIVNNGRYGITDISFISSVPQTLGVPKSPGDIAKLDPGESQDIVLGLNAESVGKFSFSPVEILYKDKDGNKYMKAANIISVEVK